MDYLHNSIEKRVNKLRKRLEIEFNKDLRNWISKNTITHSYMNKYQFTKFRYSIIWWATVVVGECWIYSCGLYSLLKFRRRFNRKYPSTQSTLPLNVPIPIQTGTLEFKGSIFHHIKSPKQNIFTKLLNFYIAKMFSVCFSIFIGMLPTGA